MADSEDPKPTVTEDSSQQQQEGGEQAAEDTQQTPAENGVETTEAGQGDTETGAEEQQEQEPEADTQQATQEGENGQTEGGEGGGGDQAEQQEGGEEATTTAAAEQQGETTTEQQEEQTAEAAEEEQSQEQEEQEQEQAEVEKEEEAGVEEEEEGAVQENGTSHEDVQEETADDAAEKPGSPITEADKERCRMIFKRKAVDGRLDLKGFKVLFRLMGEVLSTEDADSMFQDGDRDDNGTIDFDEFCRLYKKFSEAERDRKAAVASSIEKLFPTAEDKPVELKKVESLLMKLQQPDLSMRLVREKSDLGQDDVKRLVRAMDKDGNGLISKKEFVETLCGHLQM